MLFKADMLQKGIPQPEGYQGWSPTPPSPACCSGQRLFTYNTEGVSTPDLFPLTGHCWTDYCSTSLIVFMDYLIIGGVNGAAHY